MKFSLAASAVAATAFAGVANAALDPIVVKGSKFFEKTSGKQFFIKGVAYQTDPNNNTSLDISSYKDPLANADACKRDVPKLEELGTNTIRVYAIDPEEDHSACMKLLDDAGIYVVSDLSEPSLSINRDSPSWDDKLYARYTAVVDEMSKYSNTLGFFAGNEVSNNASNTDASAFVKAAVRDMKAYIKENIDRPIPVGYATNDDPEIRLDLAHYFNCNTEEEAVDFWGYNIYSWCGDSSFQKSGYDQRTKEFEKYNKPVFLAEYGCNEVRPRKFTDVKALYGEQMTDVWSGGIVYMYFEEANEYGLVKIDGDDVEELPDFANLKKQIAAVSPKGTTMDKYTPTNTELETCPSTSDDWRASTNLPPTPNQETCTCMLETLECVPEGNPDAKEAAALFDYICGEAEGDCSGISTDGEEGKYGAFSMCGTNEKLAWVMNKYYQDNDKRADACDFEGAAKTQSASSANGQCKTLIDSAEDGSTAAAGSSSGTTSSGSGSDEGSDEGGDDNSAASTVRGSAVAAFVLAAAAFALA